MLLCHHNIQGIPCWRLNLGISASYTRALCFYLSGSLGFNMKTLCTLRYFALQKTSVLRELIITTSNYFANKVCGIQLPSA